MTGHYHHNRFWANLLVNTFYFMGISLGALFFLALQYAAEAGWATTVKRVMEAVSGYLPVGLGLMLLMLVLGAIGVHHMYEWMSPDIYKEGSPMFDEIIANKKGYLNFPFFFSRTLAYILVWGYYQRLFRKRSLLADDGGDNNYLIHFSNQKSAAIFLVFYGVTSSTSAWDWVMSIDTHWYSTMFGWYTFSGTWIGALTVITLLVLWLRRNGSLQEVQESTLHDLGKWMFAVSFLWSYLWFMQFMLIWYTNAPEEVSYYFDRIHMYGYRWPMWIMFFINFTFPMVMLMSRDAKRNSGYLIFVGLCILFGHWVDTFVMVMPAEVHEHWHIGITEITIALGFLGLFLFVVLKNLAKAPLMVKNHPYLEESKHLHT
ncbi:MAG: quinol:cytochrome C oxidoreductase [Bacteroidia bacterium]|nr:quinol:cytochrome C oxidoreductase [Bacteroidia bacterium]